MPESKPYHLLTRTSLGFWLLLIGAAGAVRFLVAVGLFGGLPLMSDARSYQLMAVRLLEGTQGAYTWPPGWPYALVVVFSIFGAEAAVARTLAATIGTVSTVLVVLLARRVLRDERSARIAGWLAALYPPAVLAVGLPHSHHLTALCLLVLALGLIEGWRSRRAAWGLVAGLALGLAVLARPSTLAFVPIALAASPFVWWLKPDRRRWLAGAGVLAFGTAGAVVAPSIHANVAHGAGPVVSTNNEKNFFLGNNRYTPLYNTHHLAQRRFASLPPEVRAYFRSVYDKPDYRKAMTQEAFRHIIGHPFSSLLRIANRARAFWGFDYIASRQMQSQMRLSLFKASLVLAAEAGSYVIVMLLAVIGLTLGWSQVHYGSLLLAIGLTYQLPYLLSFANGTYHFPLMFLVMPLAALGVRIFTSSRRRILLRSRAFWIGAAILLAVQVEYAFFTFLYAPVIPVGM